MKVNSASASYGALMNAVKLQTAINDQNAEYLAQQTQFAVKGPHYPMTLIPSPLFSYPL